MKAAIPLKGGKNILLFNRFEILKTLGEGRFGRVYKVRDKKDGNIYALKVAKDPIYVNQLLNEAQNILLINHLHLVKLQSYFYSKKDGKIYLLYEYCNGGDLKREVERRKMIKPKEALEILKEIAEGLAYLHRFGYIHSDIKPENILSKITKEKKIWKLGDFGLIKTRGFSGILDIKGTVGYIAPEVFRGEIHRSSDIFSLGCLFYYMLEGKHPFQAATPTEELRKNRKGMVEIPKNLPEAWKPVFERMVKINPFQRFRTAGELLNALKQVG